MHSNYLKIFILVAMTAYSGALFGQRGIFLTGGIEIGGTGKHYDFQQAGNKLAKGWLLYPDSGYDEFTINPEISFHYLFWDHFGISLGLKLMEKIISVHDQNFMTASQISGTAPYTGYFGGTKVDEGNFNISKFYFNPAISGYYLFKPAGSKGRPFLSYGIGFNQYISGSRDVSCGYYHTSTDENLVLNAKYKARFMSQYLEAGYFFSHGNNHGRAGSVMKMATRGVVGNISVRYSFIGNFLQADYTNTKNGTEQYHDQLSASGSYFSVVLKIGGGLFGNAMDKLYKKQHARSNTKNKELEKHHDDLVMPRTIKDRRIEVRKNIIVKSSRINFLVSDHANDDGDIVSLNLNGEWLVKDYTLVLDKMTLHAELSEGLNYLAVYAVSEGSEKPCTVSVIIDDGETQQEVILNSDMKKCESIKITVKH